jgi:hypothetical protein
MEDLRHGEIYRICPICEGFVKFLLEEKPDSKIELNWTGFCAYCEEERYYIECFEIHPQGSA